MDDDTPAWQDVHRAYLEVSGHIREAGLTAIEIPWWDFVHKRSLLLHYAAKHNIEIKLESEAQRRLTYTLTQEKEFYGAIQEELPAISRESLLETLKERGFARLLTEFQIRNLLHLLKLSSAADFSVPGAGKTTEALAYYIFKRALDDRLLVVCPKNAFAVWEEQIVDCVGEHMFKVVRVTGGRAKAEDLLKDKFHIYLITYQFLINIKDLIATLLSSGNTFLFLDESHRMKGGKASKTGNAILDIAHLPKYKLILSGTPIPNSKVDLVSQLGFLHPEATVDENNVKKHIKSIYVRTTKTELQIPPIERRLISIPLWSGQRHLYDLVTSEALRKAQEDIRLPLRARLRSIGRSAIRLLQLVSNPSLLIDSEWSNHPVFAAVLDEGDSPKLRYVCLKAHSLAKQKKKVMIWSSFVKNIELISMRLSDLGADFIHGQVEAGSEEEEETRESKIRRFHDDDQAMILVGNPAACGESISLHKVCHHAIYLDRNYNAAHYLQSEDRIHRLGLSPGQQTIIEFVVSPDTVDDAVSGRLDQKIEMMRQVLDDDDLNIEPFQVDVDELDLELGDIGMNQDDADDLLNHLRTTLKSG